MGVQSADPEGDEGPRRVILHVNFEDAAALNYVLNNVENINNRYTDIGTSVEIRVVTHGPGLHMLRTDTSPVLERIKSLASDMPKLTFCACANTRERMTKAEGKTPEIVGEATMVPSGIVEILELQRAGWQYLKP